jgi:hypothetical protein
LEKLAPDFGEWTNARREELFNRDGVYSAIVNHNLLMHREAAELGSGILKTLFEGRPENKPIKINTSSSGSEIRISIRLTSDFSYGLVNPPAFVHTSTALTAPVLNSFQNFHGPNPLQGHRIQP